MVNSKFLNSAIDNSKIKIIRSFAPKGFSLNIGCGPATMISDITLDINRRLRPTVIADATHLPFKQNIFKVVFLNDVLEHFSRESAVQLLKATFRLLKKNGKLLITIPNYNLRLYDRLDPMRLLSPHIHYNKEEICNLLTSQGFRVQLYFTSGNVITFIRNFIHFFLYPFEHYLKIKYLNIWYLDKIADKQYYKTYDTKGTETFIVSIKPPLIIRYNQSEEFLP